MPFQAPMFKAATFNCPMCHALCGHVWHPLFRTEKAQPVHSLIWTARCAGCDNRSIWKAAHAQASYGEMVWPSESTAPAAPVDLPNEVSGIYAEARAVLPHSARAASALLRLTLEGVLKKLYPDAGNLDAMIGAAVKDGLPDRTVKAMDVLRVKGNDSVHELLLDDDAETAMSMFRLVAVVVERLITEPREIDELFAGLPEGKREHIERRNARAAEDS